LINRQPIETAEIETSYIVNVTCRGADEAQIRALLVQGFGLSDLHLRELESTEAARARLVNVRGKPKQLATVQHDKGRIAHHIVPLIGKKLAKDLDRATVQRMVDAIAAGKAAAIIKKTKPRGRAIVSGGGAAAARAAELVGGI
jgi:hypothetical protein